MARSLLRRGGKLLGSAALLVALLFGVVFSALNDPWFLGVAIVVTAVLLALSERRRRKRWETRDEERLHARRLGGV
jgi:membrane protein implicated in regulation of membrane protease activity